MKRNISIIAAGLIVATASLLPTTSHSFWFGEDMAQYLSQKGTPDFAYIDFGKANVLHQILTRRIPDGNCARPFPFPPCGGEKQPACACSIVEELDQAMHNINFIPEEERIGLTVKPTKDAYPGYTLFGLVRNYTSTRTGTEKKSGHSWLIWMGRW